MRSLRMTINDLDISNQQTADDLRSQGEQETEEQAEHREAVRAANLTAHLLYGPPQTPPAADNSSVADDELSSALASEIGADSTATTSAVEQPGEGDTSSSKALRRSERKARVAEFQRLIDEDFDRVG